MMIGGKDRTLRYDWHAIRQFERETGIGFAEAFEKVERGHIGLLVDLVWAGLLHGQNGDGALTVDTVEGWLNDVDDVEALAEEIAEQAPAAFQKKK